MTEDFVQDDEQESGGFTQEAASTDKSSPTTSPHPPTAAPAQETQSSSQETQTPFACPITQDCDAVTSLPQTTIALSGNQADSAGATKKVVASAPSTPDFGSSATVTSQLINLAHLEVDSQVKPTDNQVTKDFVQDDEQESGGFTQEAASTDESQVGANNCPEEQTANTSARAAGASQQPTPISMPGNQPAKKRSASATQTDTSSQAKPEITDEEWRELREQRRTVRKQRELKEPEWRSKRNSILERLSALPLITAWVAILVVIDNCTRQCLALPLFMVGPNVTSQMIVDALQAVLPEELQYLISDRGSHFRAKIFAELAKITGFQHVLTPPHRPQSNGIAERFVRTLKEWLADKSWQSEEELLALLVQFREEYNDRPHFRLPFPACLQMNMLAEYGSCS